MNGTNPLSPCCQAATTYYDGALGYESFTCNKCGKDIADAIAKAPKGRAQDPQETPRRFAGQPGGQGQP